MEGEKGRRKIRIEEVVDEEGEMSSVYRGINDFAFGHGEYDSFLKSDETEKVPPNYLGAGMYELWWFVRVDRVAESVYKRMETKNEDEVIRKTIEKLNEATLDEILHYMVGWQHRFYLRIVNYPRDRKTIERKITFYLNAYPNLKRENDVIKMETCDCYTQEGFWFLTVSLILSGVKVKTRETREDRELLRRLL